MQKKAILLSYQRLLRKLELIFADSLSQLFENHSWLFTALLTPPDINGKLLSIQESSSNFMLKLVIF